MRSLYKIHVSNSCNKKDVINAIKNSPTEFIILLDIFTTTIEYPNSIDLQRNCLYTPKAVAINIDSGEPIGNIINHISVTQSLKIQSIHAADSMKPDYIPNCIIGHKQILLGLISKLSSMNGLFLELSLILHDWNITLIKDWIVKTHIINQSQKVRSRLASKYMPMFCGLFDLNRTNQTVLTNLHIEYHKTGLHKLGSLVNNNDILLIDSNSRDYESIRFNYRTISLDPYIPSDYYIALSGHDPMTFIPKKSFMQLTMSSSSIHDVVDTTGLDPIGTFCIKQFSDNISFGPPYTSSSNSMLTVLEIVLSFKPRSVLVISNNTIRDIFTKEGEENARRENFMSKIMSFCNENDVKIKLMSDLGALFSKNG